MTTISANVILDSVSPQGIRITTVHMRYPRMIHAELMTHRVFSRNARSSRAVPVKAMIEEIKNDPVIPLYWGKNQAGMQAGEENNALVVVDGVEYTNVEAWLKARDEAVKYATAFMHSEYHKQVVNRLLEPFMHIDTLVTSTHWANFFFLRDHGDAEPHFKDLAVVTKQAMDASTPSLIPYGGWHLPYITEDDYDAICFDMGVGSEAINPREFYNVACQISAARCARISYKPFDGDASYKREFERFDSLVNSPVHASPTEHQATPDHCWIEPEEAEPADWEDFGSHGNFWGWKQFRKFIPNEAIKDTTIDLSESV